LWPKVRTFWLEQGFQFTLEDPKIGILETDWQENRADIPQTGLRKLLGGVFDALHSAPTRDKFRTRLERGIDGTELYLTHRGAEEVSTGDTFQWQPRAADPELEAEMLNRLMVFLGVETDTANALLATPTLTSSSQVELVQTGTVKELVINDDLGRAWQRVGVVLDQLGFGIEERRRSEGIYRVRYFGTEENKGFLARLFGSDDAKEQLYQIHLLTEQEKKTRLRILDEQGQVATSKVAEQILTLLYERLK
jgi:outer membrane protein assembly factor BamC